jgi:hypothetical protein
MRKRTTWNLDRCLLVLLGLGSLLSGGCLAVAVGAGAAGAAGAYAYHKGNVVETYEGDFETTWRATHAALAELGLPVQSQSRDRFSGAMESVTGTGERIKITVEEEGPTLAGDPVRTRVGVRVATFGDADVSRRILAQIPGPAQPVAQSVAQPVAQSISPAAPAASTSARAPEATPASAPAP